jgi:hypothetical protein
MATKTKEEIGREIQDYLNKSTKDMQYTFLGAKMVDDEIGTIELKYDTQYLALRRGDIFLEFTIIEEGNHDDINMGNVFYLNLKNVSTEFNSTVIRYITEDVERAEEDFRNS